MKHELRVIRNEIVINLSLGDLSEKEIGKAVGLTQQMVSLLLCKHVQGLALTPKGVGASCRLSAAQLALLPTFLAKKAVSYGFTGDYWTHVRVGYVIQEEFGVKYEEKQVGRILHKIGWTLQKPQKKEIKQSAEKVAAWKETGLATLKKKP